MPPVPLNASEQYLFSQGGMQITLKGGPFNVTNARGELHLTNQRLVLIYGEAPHCISLFDLYDEDFDQPIFGSNYFSATIHTTEYTNVSLKACFNAGGSDPFMKLMIPLMAFVRQRRAELVRQSADPPPTAPPPPARPVAYYDPINPINAYAVVN
eukprot:NODE_2281_length_636_cov_103.950596_g1931_i0.p1 GENE.NODE_2281_length_636_cov_103.950596_g1931_i0~~NODE_2281_length_636_cov_103.950596_g1931_i0.p1  ORF type:complete len:155 (+),score=10.19 NODE_2281_length_636_cov_103.950596_g1931_i0:70-534(+)